MEKKQVTREHLTLLLAKFIKDSQKNMGDKTNVELPISISSWVNGAKKWSHTDITIGDYCDKTTYTFTDREITDEQFVYMLNDALSKSNVMGKVYADTYGDGYWTKKQTIFRRIEIYAKPCKEFQLLSDYIKKYAGKTIGSTDVFHVRVCGKRSSWSDSSAYRYLCYDVEKCKAIIDTMRAKKTSKDGLKVEIEEYFSHGDEMDYRCAQHQESEWYGCRGVMLVTDIKNTKGQLKLHKAFMDFR